MSDNQLEDLYNDNDEEIANPQGEQPATPKALREAYKREKERREAVERELNEFKTTLKRSEVESKVKAAGIPEAFIEDALRAEDPGQWIEARRGLFGGAGTEETPDNQEPSGQPALSPDEIKRMQGVQGINPGAYTPGSMDEIQTRVSTADSSAKSREEFYAELEKMGALGNARP